MPSPISVLHLITSLEEGGTERQALQLMQLQRATGRFRVSLAVLDHGQTLLEEFRAAVGERLGEPQRYPLVRFAHPRTVRQGWRLARWLRQHRVDVLHTHGFYANVFGLPVGALAGVPIRVGAKREQLQLRDPLRRRLELRALRSATCVVANCHAIREELESAGLPASRLRVVYNAVDPARVHASSSPPAQLADRHDPQQRGERVPCVTLIANCRLAAKDQDTFLRAAHRLHGTGESVRFVIAGDGPRLSALRALADTMGLGGVVRFVGRAIDVASLLVETDVGVLSSRSEGFPNVVLEYMAAGRPVVATDVGGVREAVVHGQTGYLVAPGDDQALADRVAALLHDPVLARAMGDAGMQRVHDCFSPHRMLEEMEAAYAAGRDGATRGSSGGRSA